MIPKRDASPIRPASNACNACAKPLKFAFCKTDGCNYPICSACIKGNIVHCLKHNYELFYEEKIPGKEWIQKRLVYTGLVSADAIVAHILENQAHPEAQFNAKVYLQNSSSELRFRIGRSEKFVRKIDGASTAGQQTSACEPHVKSPPWGPPSSVHQKVNPTFSF
jgi:hypothetical protein